MLAYSGTAFSNHCANQREATGMGAQRVTLAPRVNVRFFYFAFQDRTVRKPPSLYENESACQNCRTIGYAADRLPRCRAVLTWFRPVFRRCPGCSREDPSTASAFSHTPHPLRTAGVGTKRQISTTRLNREIDAVCFLRQRLEEVCRHRVSRKTSAIDIRDDGPKLWSRPLWDLGESPVNYSSCTCSKSLNVFR